MADLPIRRGRTGAIARPRAWDPFERMQEMMSVDPLDLMGRMLGERDFGATFTPAFEVKETGDAYIFKADLPGVQEKDVDISITGDRIQVSGKREEEKKEESERYYAYERNFGAFTRSFTLPEGVDSDNVDAQLKDGVLSLHVPKKAEVQPKRIKLGGGGNKSEKAKA